MATVLKSADLSRSRPHRQSGVRDGVQRARDVHPDLHTQFATTQQSMSRENLYPLAMGCP